ncbi:hypothetical protein M7I_6544 [Glarea lozoyensis 74030]|nr:hypothetical protein M7I_6544 [Glarea lozoyensis 74030]
MLERVSGSPNIQYKTRANKRNRVISIKKEAIDEHAEGETVDNYNDSEIEMGPINKKAKTAQIPEDAMAIGVAAAEPKAVVYAFLSKAEHPALLFRIDNARVRRKSQTEFATGKMSFDQIKFDEAFHKGSEGDTKNYIRKKLMKLRGTTAESTHRSTPGPRVTLGEEYLSEVSNGLMSKNIQETGTKNKMSLPDPLIGPSATGNGQTKNGNLNSRVKDTQKAPEDVTSITKLPDEKILNVASPDLSTLSVPTCGSSEDNLKRFTDYSDTIQKYLDGLHSVFKHSLEKKDEVIHELRSELEKAKSAEAKDKKRIKSMTFDIARFTVNTKDLRAKVEKLSTELTEAKAMTRDYNTKSRVAFEFDKAEKNKQEKDIDIEHRVQDSQEGAHSNGPTELEGRVEEAACAKPSARVDNKFRPDKTLVVTPGQLSSATTFSKAEKSTTASVSKGETPSVTETEKSQTKPAFQMTDNTEVKVHQFTERGNIKSLNLLKGGSVSNTNSATPLVDLAQYVKISDNEPNGGMLKESRPRRVTYGNRSFDEINILYPLKDVTMTGKANGSVLVGRKVYQRYTHNGETKLLFSAGHFDSVVDRDGRRYLKNVALKEHKPEFDL